MLDKGEFLKGINFIKANYISWNFDLHNDLMLSVWYKRFSDLDNKTFSQLLDKYVEMNKYPPNSPNDIMDCIPKTFADGNEAWEVIMDIYDRASDIQFFKSMVNKEQPELYKFISKYDFYNVPEDSYGNKCLGDCIGKHFKREYNAYISRLNVRSVNGYLIENQTPKKTDYVALLEDLNMEEI